jgi:hypothetical protein
MNRGREFIDFISRRCNHSAFIHTLACVVFTLVAQVVITVRFVRPVPVNPQWNLNCHHSRIYAVTLKHRLVTGIFAIAIILQFGLGLFMTYLAVKFPGTGHSFRVHLRLALMWSQHTPSLKLAFPTATSASTGTTDRRSWLMRALLCYSVRFSPHSMPEPD